MELRIFKCMHCGNIIEMIDDHHVPVMCCGEKMKEFKAGETDGAAEKHVPVVTVEGDVVRAKGWRGSASDDRGASYRVHLAGDR